MGRSVLSGYNDAQAAMRAAQSLDHVSDELIGARPSVLTAQPTPVHAMAVDVLERLMHMGMENATDETPLQMKVMLRGLTQVRPFLLETFAKVDPALIVHFMRELREQITDVIDAGENYLTPDPNAIDHPHDHAAARRPAPPRPVEAPAVDVEIPFARDDAGEHDEQPASAG